MDLSRSPTLDSEQQLAQQQQRELQKEQLVSQKLPELTNQLDKQLGNNSQLNEHLSKYAPAQQQEIKQALGTEMLRKGGPNGVSQIDRVGLTKDGNVYIRFNEFKQVILAPDSVAGKPLGSAIERKPEALAQNKEANIDSERPQPTKAAEIKALNQTEAEKSSRSQSATERELAAIKRSEPHKAEPAKSEQQPSGPASASLIKDPLAQTQRLDGINQQVAEKSTEQLKSYTPEQQKQLISALSKEISDVTSNEPKIERVSINDQGELVAHYNRGSEIGINPQEILQAEHQKADAVDLQAASLATEPISAERQAELDRIAQITAGLQAGIDPSDPEWAEKMQAKGLIPPEPEKSTEARYTAKEGDSALKVAKALDSEHPTQALGHLRETGQIKYIEGDNGNLIPNTKAGRTYTYDPEQYSAQERAQLEITANKGISQESKINQQTADSATNWFAKSVEQGRLAAEQNPNWINQAVVNLSVPNAQNFYSPAQTEPIKATTNQRIMGLDQDQIDQRIAEGIQSGHSDVRIALTLTAKHMAYEAWNLGTLGFVKENDQLIVQRDSGNISDKQYWQAATVSGGTKIAAIATGGVAGYSAKLATPAGLAAVGMAMDAEVQLGSLGVHKITDGKVGQESYSFTQTAAMGLGGYGLGKLAAMPIMNKPLFQSAQQEAAALNTAAEQQIARTAEQGLNQPQVQALTQQERLEQQSLQATQEALKAQGHATESVQHLAKTQQLETAAQAERVAAEQTKKAALDALEQAENQLKQGTMPELSLSRHQEKFSEATERLLVAQTQEQAAALARTQAVAETKLAQEASEQALQRAQEVSQRAIDIAILNPARAIVYVEEAASLASFRSNMTPALEEVGLTMEAFQELKLTRVQDLTKTQAEQLKLIRDRVPEITTDTPLYKFIPEEYLEGILNNPRYAKVGGYIAKAEDVQHIKIYEEVLESIRLDYAGSAFTEGKNSYALVKFKVQKTEGIEIPYGERLAEEGKFFVNTPPPATQNGFLASRNGEVIPEWHAPSAFPQDGAELYRVVNGKEELVGRFMLDENSGAGQFVRIPKD